MALSPLGIFSAAGAGGGAAQTFELIRSEILTGTQSSVTFSNLGDFSSTYRHLQIRFTAKDTRTAADSSRLYLRMNGATSNYRYHVLFGNSGSLGSGVGFTTDRIVMEAAMGQNPTSNFGMGVLDLLDVYASKNKTMRGFTGHILSGYSIVALTSGAWFDTTALSSITLGSDFGDFVAGSRFSLYGIRG